jgi:ATP-binding cassette subfamily F protein uup
VRPLVGGVDDYLARRRVLEEAAPVVAAASLPKSTGAVDRETQKSLARLERQIERMRARESSLHDDLAEHATDFERVTALHDELRAVESERESLEEEWLELAT